MMQELSQEVPATDEAPFQPGHHSSPRFEFLQKKISISKRVPASSSTGRLNFRLAKGPDGTKGFKKKLNPEAPAFIPFFTM